ncbi:hypothetical protein LTR95_007010 [Oleoguttula sp. CCFEE 5521]
MFARFSKSSPAPTAPNAPPDADATTPGAQDDASADEPIEEWEVVGDDWGIIPGSAEVREERREDERLARSTASQADNTDDANEGAEAPPLADSPEDPSAVPGSRYPSTEQPSAQVMPEVDQLSAMPPAATSSTATQDDFLSNTDAYQGDAFSGAHYGDRHEYTNWDAHPRTSLSTSAPVLGYGSATKVGLGARAIEPMGSIATIIAQGGGHWPDVASLPSPSIRATSPPHQLLQPTPPLPATADRTAHVQDPDVRHVSTTALEDDFIPIDAQEADPRIHNETLETHIRLLQTENASQRYVIETLRQEIESTRRAQSTQLRASAGQPVTAGAAPAEDVVTQPLPMQSATPQSATASAEDGGAYLSSPPVPTMAFNDESVDLTQHLDSVRVHIQALKRHVQQGQDVLLEQIDGLLQRIDTLERWLRWREETEVGRLMASIEREEEDAAMKEASESWFEGTGLWTNPTTQALRPAATQLPGPHITSRSTTSAPPAGSPILSAASSSRAQAPPSSTPAPSAYTIPGGFLELTQPRSYPLDHRLAASSSAPTDVGAGQTLITEHFCPLEAASPRSQAASLVSLGGDSTEYDDLYAPASPRSHAAGIEPPCEDLTDHTELYQAASPRAGDPVREGRWTFSPTAASFHPDAAEHNIRARAGLQPTELQCEPPPIQLNASPVTTPANYPQLSSQEDLKAELAETAPFASVCPIYQSPRDEDRPQTPRTLPAVDVDEPSPLSLDVTTASPAQVYVAPQSAPMPMLDPRRQSIPASARAASFSQRVPIIPSDTQERRQRRKRRKNAAALAG